MSWYTLGFSSTTLGALQNVKQCDGWSREIIEPSASWRIAQSVSCLGYGLGDQFRQGHAILLSSTPALGSTQSPNEWVTGIKRRGREADRSSPYRDEDNDSAATPPLPFKSSRPSV
jgi:hypothetical protein